MSTITAKINEFWAKHSAADTTADVFDYERLLDELLKADALPVTIAEAKAAPDQVKWRQERAATIQKARDRYASDVLEIDADPLLAPCTEGTFVNAWVWVPNENKEG